MTGPPRPSFPAPSEPSFRRLGVGGPGRGGDRPLRAQLVIALVAGLILLAVPLYLWRRPGSVVEASASASAAPSAAPAVEVVALEAGAGEPVELGPVQRVKCAASPGARGQEGSLCDALPFFDDALAKAIKATFDCAPRTGKDGTLNYVLTVDFASKRVTVFAGASGQWRGPQAKRAVKCVEGALPKPPWSTIQHQYRYYRLAILARYPAPGTASVPGGGPVFDAPGK